ncbi:MAG: Flagellar biosynthetic protein FlhB [Ignavibacteria bacterium]|nr:Flagellar biosynthetic protein FlhB [Ignavibacteria bacterium]
MAENQDGQEKSEPASAKRLHEARLRGQVSKSHDVTTGAILLFGGIAIFIFGAQMVSNIQVLMKHIFINLSSIEITYQNIIYYYPQFLGILAKLLLPVLITIMIIIFIAEVSQVGLKFATKKFTEGLNFKQILNPFTGLKKLFFSGRSFFELLKSMLKLIIVGAVVVWVLKGRSAETVGLVERPFSDIGNFMVSLSFELILKVGIVFIIIAVGDYFYQKHRFLEDMKMTKQEVKEEYKQTEGDPKIKARLRSIMRQRIRRLMLAKVREADVVITNPTHFAVALKYQPDSMSSPIVVAKGVDFLAFQIRDIALKADIPVIEEPPLARQIYFNVEIDEEIPELLFKAVAQVLAYVYQLKQNKRFV